MDFEYNCYSSSCIQILYFKNSFKKCVVRMRKARQERHLCDLFLLGFTIGRWLRRWRAPPQTTFTPGRTTYLN